MKEAEEHNVEQKQGPKRRGRRGKWWILLVVLLVAAGIAAAFYFRGPGLNEQLEKLKVSGTNGVSLSKIVAFLYGFQDF